MGSGSSSPRKIEVENDGNVIRVSDAVVDRLKGIRPEESRPKQDQTVIYNNQYAPSGGVSSLEFQKALADALSENDKYWNDRLAREHASSRSIEDVLKEEYFQTLRKVESAYPERGLSKKVPCEDVKKRILKCYQENRHRSLECSGEVLSFQNCLVNRVQ